MECMLKITSPDGHVHHAHHEPVPDDIAAQFRRNYNIYSVTFTLRDGSILEYIKTDYHGTGSDKDDVANLNSDFAFAVNDIVYLDEYCNAQYTIVSIDGTQAWIRSNWIGTRVNDIMTLNRLTKV